MAIRSIKSPTVITPTAVVSSSVINKPQSIRFSLKPTAATTLAVHNRGPSFYGTGSNLKLKLTKFRCSASALSPQLKDTLEKLVSSEKVVLFMKGNKDFPMCGFSNTVVQILKNLNVPFEDVNILENELLRQGLKEYSNWPTFPQLYIGGEFFGGCDITIEAFKSGELQEAVERAMCS
ncbi:PREDICTED: monothiol glutaredoxin-S14, chloroplastic [Camelina sativa]|uniref:Monothiol glutaredoxin-S14, chloroplastic n=1 Tax=Camelina sativa TaxID=90675 RepID=A0ABM0YQ88_CAMSA|nr:PREDICTED: monothiol glutaredoxin-S14, chloroplastic [Camelina sativa]